MVVKNPLNRPHDPTDVCHKGCFGICRREFAQQTLKYNQFYVKPTCFSLVYAFIGVAVLAVSMVFKSDLTNVYTVGPLYYKEDDCTNQTTPCMTEVPIQWDGPTGKEIMVYYWLEGFMQVHRSFTMNGYFKNGQYVFRPVQNDSFFNDSYSIVDNDNKPVVVDETKIAFPADIDFLLAPGDHGLGGKWNGKGNRMGFYIGTGKTGVYNYGFCTKYKNCESTTERELVWRKPSPGLHLTTKWPKLYGRIRGGFTKKGTYTVRVDNRYPVDYFGGKKGIYLSTMGAYGGKFGTTWLADLSLCFGIMCIGLSVVMCVIQMVFSKSRNLPEFLEHLQTSRPETLAQIRIFKPNLSTFCDTGVNEAKRKVELARQSSDVHLAEVGNVTPK